MITAIQSMLQATTTVLCEPAAGFSIGIRKITGNL